MACLRFHMLVLFLLLASGVLGSQESHDELLLRHNFPPDFIFGAGTSAFQVEGAAAEDGRSPCVMDIYTHAGKVLDKSVADVSSDQYHKYKEDVKLMYDMGLPAYRFSISWSRLLPEGRGSVNPKGLQYYNNLINELLKYGIQPHVTLLHFDLPQVLQDEYGGWLSKRIVGDFTAYADVCFREFGDRVAYWITINEPNAFALGGYDQGQFPPQRCSRPYGNCTEGNSTVEPYIVTHNQLLAHAATVRLYKQKYKAEQNGWIGLTLLTFGYDPKTNRTEDVAAMQRAFDFMVGWYLSPLVFGDYPEIMKKNVGSRLPTFSRNQSALVKGSIDFIGINHYATFIVSDDPPRANTSLRDFYGDMMAKTEDTGTGSTQVVAPWGLEGLLEYIKISYGNPPIFLHENGISSSAHHFAAHLAAKGYGILYSMELNDSARIYYLNAYISYLLRAIRNGSNTKGYFVWSFIDAFELLYGYQTTYGLYNVDFNDTNRTRRARHSARWYSDFLKNKRSHTEEILSGSSSASLSIQSD